ncbi:MAG: MmgE/PrpD family protein, partial [Proteobacteria bacterium]|nr:MmgE/PrpD family protein [Pseudomonadota bacterium]
RVVVCTRGNSEGAASVGAEEALGLGRKLASSLGTRLCWLVWGPLSDAEAEKAGSFGVDDIDRISIETQESGVRIIDKTGALHNPADRDHCIQYMVAVALIKGNLTAEDYEDDVAADPRIDALRDKMQVNENERFSEDYLDPHKRSIANAVQVFFADGTKTDRIEVDYPMGHRRRRGEGIPLLNAKFERNIATRLNLAQCERIFSVCNDQAQLESTPVDEFIGMWVV